MSKSQQSDLSEYAAGTTTETVTRTIKCPLETSERKREYLRDAIEEWQGIARFTADRLKSFDRGDVSRNNQQVGSIVKNWDCSINKSVAQEAAYKAVEAYESWYELGCEGKPPMGMFGDGDYLRVRNQQLTISENNRGYGVKLNIVPYDPEWFHIGGGSYQAEWLERVVDEGDSARIGSSEVRLSGNSSASLHLAVVTEVEVYEPADVSTTIGVDLGENVIYAAAVVGSDGVNEVKMEPGKEFRHYREQLDRKRKQLSEKGDLRGVRECKGERERYTDHVTHTASKALVSLAQNHAPCVIRLEDLGNYRQTANDPIHDWPRGMLAEQICYKATAAGIPVEFTDPAYTSQTCRKCGQTDAEARNGADFKCRRCGYEVHADVNAAINIATTPT